PSSSNASTASALSTRTTASASRRSRSACTPRANPRTRNRLSCPLHWPDSVAKLRNSQMASIIKARATVNDDWTVVRAAEDGALPAVDALPAGKVLVPLALWQSARDALAGARSRADIGVWPAPDSEPADIVGDFDRIALI